MESVGKCPFCGGQGKAVRTKDFSGYWYCECEKCYARQLAYSKDQKEAIRLWNTRNGSSVYEEAIDNTMRSRSELIYGEIK